MVMMVNKLGLLRFGIAQIPSLIPVCEAPAASAKPRRGRACKKDLSLRGVVSAIII